MSKVQLMMQFGLKEIQLYAPKLGSNIFEITFNIIMEVKLSKFNGLFNYRYFLFKWHIYTTPRIPRVSNNSLIGRLC